MKNIKYSFSIAAGLISTSVVTYSLLAPIWMLPFADKAFSTGSILVMMLSMILTVFTGQKISENHTPEKLLEDVKTREIFENDLES